MYCSDAPLSEARFFRDVERDLRDYLAREQRQEVQVNRKLKLYARVGETEEQFAQRCDEAAQAAADAEASKLRDRYDARMDTVRDAIERAPGPHRRAEDGHLVAPHRAR